MRSSEEEAVLVQLHGKVAGPFQVKELRNLRGFSPQSLVSHPGSDKWAPAFRVLRNIHSYEPPVMGVPHVTLSSIHELMPVTAAAQPTAFDWKAERIPGAWVDRWFKRVAIFNAFLAIGIYGGWSYAPVRIPVQKELQRQITEQMLHWGPMPIRVVQYHGAPAKNRFFHKSTSRTV